MSKQATKLTTLALGAVLSSSLLPATATAQTQVRLQSSTDAAAFSEGYALSVEDWSARTFSARNNNTEGFKHESRERPQVWIADIGTLLFDDADGDGFHSGFSVNIDVDSEFGDTEVYAKIYLEPEDDVTILLHETGNFTVYGSIVGDEYRIDTELRSNYATKYYSVAIDIHDAWTDELLDSATSRGFDNLSQLPLESSNQNQSLFGDLEQEIQGEADVVVTEYAGLFHPLLLLILAAGVALRGKKTGQ